MTYIGSEVNFIADIPREFRISIARIVSIPWSIVKHEQGTIVASRLGAARAPCGACKRLTPRGSGHSLLNLLLWNCLLVLRLCKGIRIRQFAVALG